MPIPSPARAARRVFLLLVDGLRPDVAEARLAEGELPHLARMIERGGSARAITVFPSTTSVAYLPFLTGATPGRSNIPSIRWLDRSAYGGRWWRDRHAVRSYCGYQATLLDGDLPSDVPTIFELVPESLAIFTPVARGLTRERDPSRVERGVWGAIGHFGLWHQPSDDVVSKHLLRSVDGPWRFVFAQFPAVDGYTHQSGHDSPPVHRALRRVDRTVGRLVERLRARGELDDALILLVSDHGASAVHTHFDLPGWFRGRGVPTLSHPVVWERGPKAAVMIAGNASAMVYARPGEPRPERWPVERLMGGEAFGVTRDLVRALAREPAVAIVVGESEAGGLWIGGAEGDARIRRDGERLGYRPLSGDPLGIGGARVLDERQWLEATWDAMYPDAVFHLWDQFRASRAGDLLVVAREGYDLRGRWEIPEHKAGHGGLVRSHMQTPLLSSEPLPDRPLRTPDLFPAILEWLGEPLPEGLEAWNGWQPGQAAAERERLTSPV